MTDGNSPEHAEPKVSVVIPTFNATGCIERALRSVQAQTLQDFEIIVVDDASTDATRELVSALAASDPRIRLIACQVNGGPSVARNRGFEAARGAWIAILDADDVYRPERLATLVARAEAASLDMVADNIDLDDYHAGVIIPQVIDSLKNYRARYMPVTLELFLQNDFVDKGYQLGLMKPIYRTAFLRRNGLAYPTRYRHGEDSYLYSAVLASGARAEIARDAFYIYTPTFGPVSRKVSEHSRTKTDYVKKAQSCDDFIREYGARISPEARRLVERRRRRMLAFDEFLITLEGRKRLGPVGVARRLLGHPSSFQFLAPMVVKKLKSKLRLSGT